MRLAINSKRALFVSVALHALVFAAFASTATSRSSSPRGVRRAGDADLIEIGVVGHRAVGAARAPAPAKVRRTQARLVEGQAPIAKTGFAEGTSAEGPLGAPNGMEASERERYLFELRVLLEGRKIYPKVSRYMNESGRVTVKFLIQQDGRIESVEVVRPSAFDRLNQAAHQLVSGLNRYKPLPRGAETAMTVELPIEYVLR